VLEARTPPRRVPPIPVQDPFDGRIYAALAANSGGPGNAAVWPELASSDDDLLAEVVRYSETRTNVRRICELYAIYRGLYSGP